MTQILTFEEGEAGLIRAIASSKSHPFIGVVYGVQDSGKTHLIESVLTYFQDRGRRTQQRQNQWNINHYESWAHSTWEFKDPRPRKSLDELPEKDIVLYHCSWHRTNPWKDIENPDITLKRFGIKPDLTLGIFNPKRSLVPEGQYDFIISNSKSTEKPMASWDWC